MTEIALIDKMGIKLYWEHFEQSIFSATETDAGEL